MAHKSISTGIVKVECDKKRRKVHVTHTNDYPGIDLAEKVWKAHKRAAMRAWEREMGVPAFCVFLVNAICSAETSTTIYEVL